MTRPIDIRDIVPRDAVLGDKRLGTDGDDNLVMTNQPDNSTIGTAASRNIGTAEDQIPLNSDLPASAKSGDYNDLDNLPILGTAAEKDTGMSAEELPTNSILSMVGASINFTDNNLNPNIFGGVAPGHIIGDTIFPANGVFDFTLQILSNTAPVSITTVGTFDVYDILGSLTDSGLSATLQGNSSNRTVVINLTGATGLTVGDKYTIRTGTASSKITVNF